MNWPILKNKMRKELTILIIVYNKEKNVKAVMQSLRTYADVDNLSVVVVDNGSTDGLRNWAASQEDFTYVYMDEGKLPFGAVINMVKKELEIKGDLLITNGCFLLTPNCLSRMLKTLYEEKQIGAVGALSFYFWYFNNYQTQMDMCEYEEMINRALNVTECANKQVMALEPETILFKAEMLEKLEGFDESFDEQVYVMKDYCLNMVINDWKLMVCNTAFWYNVDASEDWKQYPNPLEDIKLEQKWGMHYFGSLGNGNVADRIKEDKNAEFSVLEVGCDCGATLLEIKNRYPNVHVYGSEINEKSAEIAAHIATVTIDNIEECNLKYEAETFDYIIFADVLEHLKNPEEVIKYSKTLLKKGGSIIANIPNLSHISVVEQLLRGNFTYTETGLLDKTHIHFFVYNEIIKMFEETGLSIYHIVHIREILSEQQETLINKLLSISPELEEHMLKTFQYLVCAKK